MRVIIVPAEGEWVAVPAKPSDELLNDVREAIWQRDGVQYAKTDYALMHAAMIAAAPPCKVVELPQRQSIEPRDGEYDEGVMAGWNACLGEIERRAKE